MLMIRMEIACFLVITFMAIMYFSAKRKELRYTIFFLHYYCYLQSI